MSIRSSPLGRLARAFLWIEARSGVLVVVLGLAAIASGIVGLLQAPGDRPSVWALAYGVARLFALEDEMRPEDGVALTLARMFAVLFLVGGAWKLLSAAFVGTADRLRLAFVRGHTLVCGLGRIGRRLVEDLRSKGADVGSIVVVGPEPLPPDVGELRADGVIVVPGDPSDRRTLERARAALARRVFAVMERDSVNADILWQLRELRARLPPNALRDVHCHAHAADPEIVRVLSRRRPASGTGASPLARELNLDVFNVYANTARRLFQCDVPPPREGSVAHYVLLGFGAMGQTLALHAAQLAHFRNLKRLRMTIVDEAIVARRDAFLARFPQFSPEHADLSGGVPDDWADKTWRPAPPFRTSDTAGIEYACNAEFVDLPADVEDGAFVERLSGLLSRRGVDPIVFVCFDREEANFDAAVRVRDRLRERLAASGTDGGLRVFVWLPAQPGLAALLPGPDVRPFGATDVVCALDEVRNDAVLGLAADMHRQFAAGFRPGQAWEELDDVLRMSNIWAAIHTWVKLRDHGFRVVRDDREPTDVAEFDDREADSMARVEHNRWVAERLLAGVRFGPRGTGMNPLLRPWASLGAEVSKDLAQVRGIPERLAGHGLRIRRAP